MKEALEQPCWIAFSHDQRPMLGADEMVLHRAVKLSEESVVEPLHVQQAARFSVEAELGPGKAFIQAVLVCDATSTLLPSARMF